MTAELFGWTREIDWGNAPSWIAALTALTVAVFTIVNVQTARKAYVRGVQTDEVATARLVWSVVTQSGTLEGGDFIPKLKGVDSYQTSSAQVTTVPGDVTRVNQRSVYVVLEITNNSNEPIGDVDTIVYEFSGRPAVELSNKLTVLGPNCTQSTFHMCPARQGYIWSQMHSSVRFHDSAGLVWRRTDTAPPERDEGKVATKIYEQKQSARLERQKRQETEERLKKRDERRAAAQAKKAAGRQDNSTDAQTST